MVSLRRRRLLGLCSGNNSFVTPLPLYCENLAQNLAQYENPRPHVNPISEQSVVSDIASVLNSVGTQNFQNTIVKDESGSSNVSSSSLSIEQPSQQITGLPVKRRKQHSRKPRENQETCLMRGVYFKNNKWQAAIKVDKKQIHLGTVESQQEAARLYDRAAFMCGREPNFELSDEEKLELSQLKWEEFLAVTRQTINCKKHKRSRRSRLLTGVDEPSSHRVDCDDKQVVTDFSVSDEADQKLVAPENL
ncbi:ethylene-responsive transcription factor-like protein At4g13040 [Vicia villosa]|uniref:ethylene-responsive transcription factor-like protein At4g13040 n=1 Tax=Vicia villosa TaxID=3911 RepID=UPI00273B8196|nr:ethylene-responsive transcription factor-like protein At4g13040 [Vicia villosa]XP_058745396.1 ethylene-responsive transcription factor-like protein At4g13040 [Vicia villosa]XP_058745397.1 ethylene-responsive transcription factor-like protein At4g13040 [Vicia villosa]XP_058745399.1 ethylene-responsive transcription factor-like protein At4g13040 [Vicia villosa]XP_058745400.1 ethylene-responsive transcription factor-like protein At4g13040 [Vicia villosa]